MAIDTENKRRSVQAYTFGLMRPLADGVIGTGDRATAAWLYASEGYGAPPAADEAPRLRQYRFSGPNHYFAGLSPFNPLDLPIGRALIRFWKTVTAPVGRRAFHALEK